MPGTFTEQNVEDMVIHAVESNGWSYYRAEDLPRAESDVLVETHLRDALIRLNPCIAENPAHADTVIYKLRALISTVRPHDLVTQNERFKKLIFEENSFPFDKDGRSISIRFFDYDNPDNSSVRSSCDRRQFVCNNGGKLLLYAGIRCGDRGNDTGGTEHRRRKETADEPAFLDDGPFWNACDDLYRDPDVYICAADDRDPYA